MLGFFRRHQKGFFIVVTFFIVVSFCFFGTYSAFTKQDKLPDREIGHLIDGSVLKEQRLHALLRILQNGVEEGGRNLNLLSDSMVHKDLILSGLGEILAEHHFDEIKGELEERWKRAKHYIPYVHPYSPSISAKNVWSQFSPKIIALLEDLKKAPEEFSKEQLPLLFDLYSAQAEFPPALLHQMLYYQQGNGEQIRHDPGLPQANVALFGFQSVSDWFGDKFVEEIGKLILNAACIAREEGYKVSKEEARIDLFSNVYHGLKTFSRDKNPSSEEAQKYFTGQLRSIGLDEDHAAALWREVLYFRRLFNEVGNAVFVDSLGYNQFKNFAKPAHQICRYKLPRSLRFENFREMLKFQRYLEIVAKGDYFHLPESFRSAEEIMGAYPELVYKEFEVEVASATKEDAAAQISLKQTWAWESTPENFDLLKKEFPSLTLANVESVEGRMEALDKLDEVTRFKADQFARLKLVEAHPELIGEVLSSTHGEGKTLKVTLKKGESPFSGEQFLALLEIEDPSLSHYTVDGETFYSIKVLEKGKGWHLLTFEEADLPMEKLLDNLLMTAYPSLKIREPFEDAKDLVGSKVYADLLKSIASRTKITELNDYAKHRFDGYLEEMRTLAMTDPTAFEQAQSGKWKLEVREEQLAFEDTPLAVGEFSPLKDGQFYKLLEKVESSATSSEIASVKEHLKRDAEKELMRKVLKRL